MFTHLVRKSSSLIVFSLCAVLVGIPAHAQKPSPATTQASDKQSDKLDVTDLEKKYWSAKDTDFSVVQNRTYTKAGRFAVSAQYGMLLNDSFNKASVINGALNYYFSERLGVEAMYTSIDSKDSKTLQAFRSTYGTNASHNQQKSFYGAALNWVPFYAKMSVLNSSITYFDMAVSPFVGITSYDQVLATQGNRSQTALTYGLGVTQSFFLSKHFAVRADYKLYWFSEKTAKYSGAAGGTAPEGSPVTTDTSNYSQLLLGMTFFF